MLTVSGILANYFGLLPTEKLIGIFIVQIVYKILREITIAITTGAPGKVKKIGEFD